MSTLKCNNAQIGQSATASNNFTWYQPTVPDGTVRLGQGNSGATTQDVIKCDSSGNLTIPGSIYQGSGTVAAERIVQGTAQTTNGAAAYGYTGLPSWVKKFTLVLAGCGNSVGANTITATIGSGSYQTSGYTGTQSLIAGSVVSASNISSGLTFNFGNNGYFGNGFITFNLVNSSTNTWSFCGSLGLAGYQATTNGYVALSGTLDRAQISMTGVATTFSGGTLNIIYEG